MLREINLDEISDGKLYSSNDMARTDCKGCDGCSACCHGMGSSIVLDPLDVYRLSINLSKPVNELLAGPLELNVADGIILPNLKMTGTKEACSFLDADGRCTVHAFRPGICRMFPLGRFYENHSFQFLSAFSAQQRLSQCHYAAPCCAVFGDVCSACLQRSTFCCSHQ